MRKKSWVGLSVFLISLALGAQTFDVHHQINWATTNQYMWGPNDTAWTLNINQPIFQYSIDENNTLGDISHTILGDYGAEIDLHTYLMMGSDFSAYGFSSGSVDVSYPVDIQLSFPSAGTPIPGQYFPIHSDYSVLPGWDLTTHFPETGVINLDLDYGLSVQATATICVVSCFTTNLLDVNIPDDSVTIFEINAYTGMSTYPCIENGYPAICQSQVIPLVLNNIGGIGLNLFADIPYIETTDYLGSDKCLYAKGQDYYLTLSLDILTFLGFLADALPSPELQDLLDLNSGTIDLGSGMTLGYEIISTALLSMDNYLHQNFSFCPTIYTELTFPQALDYFELNPATGDTVQVGTNDTIVFKVANDLYIRWPCFGVDHFDPSIRHWMHNDFRNHTWDSLTFSFTLEAFTFTLYIPFFAPNPSFETPTFCVENPQGGEICFENIYVETQPLTNEDLTITIGPLFSTTIPLGYIPVTWFDKTWELCCFDTLSFPSVHLASGPFMTLNIIGDTVLCNGDTTGVIIAHVENGAGPYTFTWSTGAMDTHMWNNDSIMVSAGPYSVTVSDAGGCTLSDAVNVFENSPIHIQLTKEDVRCEHDSTGAIYATVTGGTPGYSYYWTPGGATTQNYTNIPAGTYVLLVTDTFGCTAKDSIVVVELYPKPPVNVNITPLEGCDPLLVYFSETNPPAVSYVWSFGDGSYDTLQNTSHLYDSAGVYDVVVTVTNQYDCDSVLYLNDIITVHPKPVANFDAVPDTVYSMIDPSYTVLFNNQSEGYNQSVWDFNDPNSPFNISMDNNTSHSFSGEGVYNVILIVSNEYGCLDTISKPVVILDDVLTVPNVITPNNDGFNDQFVVKNLEKYPENELFIYDRWGKLIYHAKPYKNDWDGKDHLAGTYYFVLYPNRYEKKFDGTITIIK